MRGTYSAAAGNIADKVLRRGPSQAALDTASGSAVAGSHPLYGSTGHPNTGSLRIIHNSQCKHRSLSHPIHPDLSFAGSMTGHWRVLTNQGLSMVT